MESYPSDDAAEPLHPAPPDDIFSEDHPANKKTVEDDKLSKRLVIWTSADGSHTLTQLTSSLHLAEDLTALGLREEHAQLMAMSPVKKAFHWRDICGPKPHSYNTHYALAGPSGTHCLIVTTLDSACILAPVLPVTADQPYAPYLCHAIASLDSWAYLHSLSGFAEPPMGQVLTTSGTTVPAEEADPSSILAGRIRFSRYTPEVYERLAKARFLTTVLDIPQNAFPYNLPSHVAGTLDLPPVAESFFLEGLVSAGGLIVHASHGIHATGLRHLHHLHCTSSPRFFALDLASIDHITATGVEFLAIDRVARVKTIVASGRFISMRDLTEAETLHLDFDHLHLPLLRFTLFIDTGRTSSVFLPSLNNPIQITCPEASIVILPRATLISQLTAPKAKRLIAPGKGVLVCDNRQIVIDRETPDLDLMLSDFNPYGYEPHGSLDSFRFHFFTMNRSAPETPPPVT